MASLFKVTPEFIKRSDLLIQKAKEVGVKLWNGNILLMKVDYNETTSGGIVLPKKELVKEGYKSNLSRIIALPPLSEHDAELHVGDYVMFTHEARYPLYAENISAVLGETVDENELYAVQDNQIILSNDKVTFS